MFRRDKSRKEEITESLSAGVSHLRNAASVTADAAGEALGQAREVLGEKLQQTKDTLGPKVAEQRDAARKAWGSARKAAVRAERKAKKAVGKQSGRFGRKGGSHRRSWPKALGLLAVGAAVGAAASLITRKARQTDWKEFDVREQAADVKSKLSEAASTAKDKATLAGQKASQVAKDTSVSFKDKATQFANVVKQKGTAGKDAIEESVDDVGVATGKAIDAAKTTVVKKTKAEGKADKTPASTASRNGRANS